MSSEADPDAPLVAYLLARDVLSGSTPEVARTVRDRFGADVSVLIDASNDEGGPRGLISVDGVKVSISSFSAPIPAGGELRALARSSKDPDGSLAEHTEHVVVGTVDKHVGHESSLRAALAVVKVCFALCETERVTAVMWYLSRLLLDRETFMSIVSPEMLQRYPVPIWALVKIQPFQEAGPEGTSLAGMMGFGFRRFIGRDIEFEPSAVPLEGQYARLVDLGIDLLERGLFIKDGESSGWSVDDVFRARYLDVGRAIPGPVVSFAVEKVDPTL